jgi:hypothetical protein
MGYRKVGEVARKVLDQRVMTPIWVEGWGDGKWHCCLVPHDILEGELLRHITGYCRYIGLEGSVTHVGLVSHPCCCLWPGGPF